MFEGGEILVPAELVVACVGLFAKGDVVSFQQIKE